MVSGERVSDIVADATTRGVAYAAFKNDVRQSTVERYLRELKRLPAPECKTVRRGIIYADTHLSHTEEEHPSYSLVKQFGRDWKPDFAIDLGDWLDFDYLSKFTENDDLSREGKRLQKDVDLALRDLDEWAEITSEHVKLQGNHDARLDRLIEAQPAFEWLVAPEKLFEFVQRGIHYVRDREQPYRLGKLNVIHGWYWSKYHAQKHLDALSGNVVYGHVHAFQTASKVLEAQGDEIAAWSLGCLSDKAPSYKKGRPSGWQNGFAVVYVDECGRFNLYPIRIIGGAFLFEGKQYALKQGRG